MNRRRWLGVVGLASVVGMVVASEVSNYRDTTEALDRIRAARVELEFRAWVARENARIRSLILRNSALFFGFAGSVFIVVMWLQTAVR